jgi:hypothetical protein
VNMKIIIMNRKTKARVVNTTQTRWWNEREDCHYLLQVHLKHLHESKGWRELKNAKTLCVRSQSWKAYTKEEN